MGRRSTGDDFDAGLAVLEHAAEFTAFSDHAE
jgi:hypothetical protein